MDAIKLTGDTLKSVNKDVNEEEEKLYAELYKELEETDRRISRTRRRGRGRGHSPTSSIGAKEKGKTKQVACGRGKGRATITYVRRGSNSRAVDLSEDEGPTSSSDDLKEPEYDDDGNLLSEGDFVFTSETDENEGASDYILASDHTSDDDSFTLSLPSSLR